ncbi:MAG: right-handed parallel beta-helix repeat-containing protein, partial [Armatimonadetes bacterium]|nr:right-handed parallel beta-helix repeat-containing protein [Armatimonadota bacterium]
IDLSSDGFGLGLMRDQYNHVSFYGSDGWTNGTGIVLSQHWMFGNRWGGGDWHHVAVSFSPTRYFLFIDGYPVDTARDTTKPASNTSFCTGKLPSRIVSLANLGSAGTDVDEVRISSSVRYWVGTPNDQPPARVPVAAESARVADAFPEPKKPDFSTPPAPAPRPQPAELFVAPDGDDDNPGSADKPFRTITRGVKELLPGDTLTVRGGTYREAVEIEKYGTAEKPILVRAAPGETVVIKGSELIKEWTADGETWKSTGWTRENVEKLYAHGARLFSPDVQIVYQRDGVHGDALPLYRARTAADLREGWSWWDKGTGTLTIWPVGGSRFDPRTDGVEVAVRATGVSVAGRWVTVRGFQVRQCAMVTNWAANGVRGYHNALEDCVVTWCDFGGLSLSGFDNAVRRCEASYCGNTGLGAGVGEALLVEDCLVTHNNFWRFSPGWHGGGAKIIPWFNHSVVRGSEFADNYGPGLWFDGSCNDSTIEGNRCHDNEGPGIMVEVSRNTLLRNNVCYDNRNSLPGYDLIPIGKGYTQQTCEITRVEGGAGGNGIFISSSPGTRCYNNLCYRNESAGIFAEWAKRESADVTDYAKSESRPVTMSTHDVDLRNNVLVNNLSCQLSLRRNGVDEDTYNNRSDRNLFYATNGAPLVRWGFGGLAFTTLEKWREASGFDLHGVAGGPVFEFSPGLDLRLQPDSIGVDQGELLADVPEDALGRQRPLGGAADIGPYETAGTRQIVQRPAIPRVASFFQVDLSKLVNRAFADEKADDGQGGWSDQGPTTDLRMFPTGKQTFGEVPFDILSPVGCVVLKSGYRPQSTDLPERVVIPVHHKADVLYFLHSGAWIGGGRLQWSYIIHRGDGTSETLKVIAGDSLRDWSDPNAALPFDREYPTTTTVAWSGANQTFDKVSVYRMAWVNHSDWCEVSEIEMVANEGCGVPILVAITGGMVK